MSDDTATEDLVNGADELEQGLLALIALGGAQPDNAAPAIDQLIRARAAIDAKDLSIARDAILRGQAILEHVVDQRGWWWRLVNIHQLPLFLYHVIIFVALIAAGTTCRDCSRFGVVPDSFLGEFVPTTALVAGGLGAVLRAVWFLWNQVSRRIYHRRFLLSQLAAPLTGILLGLLTYLLAKAGIFVLAGQATGTIRTPTTSVAELALCFFVGFKWEWALDRIQRLFEARSPPHSPNKPEGEASAHQ